MESAQPSSPNLEIDLERLLVHSTPLHAEVSRALRPEDKVLLAATPLGSRASPLVRIREIHHQCARLLSTGMKHTEVSAVLGMSGSRISILLADPAFRELVDFYAVREEEIHVNARTRLAALGMDAVAELHERVVDAPENVATSVLINIVETALDRAGFAPVHRTENLHAYLSPEDISALKQAGGPANVRTKEEILQSAQRPPMGEPILISVEKESEAAGGQSEGLELRAPLREVLAAGGASG